MNRRNSSPCLAACVGAIAMMVTTAHLRADALHPTYNDNVDDLARASQNPVSDMISAPFQNNLQILENGSVLNALLIQPVVPFKLSADWNLVTRTIVPVLSLSSPPPQFDKWGLGDIQQGFFFSPDNPTSGGIIWGAGPVLSYPTATDHIYGSGKWSAGPGVVGLTMRGPWVMGTLFNNLWSFAGDSDRSRVSAMTLQPFVNYNFDGGWFLQSAPLITADWTAPSGQKWIVPIGGGGGRTFRIGTQPVTALLSTFYNVERPTGGPEWNIRFQMTFMFPR
jgi:hypothetical protein